MAPSKGDQTERLIFDVRRRMRSQVSTALALVFLLGHVACSKAPTISIVSRCEGATPGEIIELTSEIVGPLRGSSDVLLWSSDYARAHEQVLKLKDKADACLEELDDRDLDDASAREIAQINELSWHYVDLVTGLNTLAFHLGNNIDFPDSLFHSSEGWRSTYGEIVEGDSLVQQPYGDDPDRQNTETYRDVPRFADASEYNQHCNDSIRKIQGFVAANRAAILAPDSEGPRGRARAKALEEEATQLYENLYACNPAEDFLDVYVGVLGGMIDVSIPLKLLAEGEALALWSTRSQLEELESHLVAAQNMIWEELGDCGLPESPIAKEQENKVEVVHCEAH